MTLSIVPLKGASINVFLIKAYSRTDKIKVFLSCNCDDSYIKQNTLLFDYVRDRTLSDIEVFVFDISNASGGRNFTFEYKGKNDFQNKENKISTNITQNLSLAVYQIFHLW